MPNLTLENVRANGAMIDVAIGPSASLAETYRGPDSQRSFQSF